MNKNVIVLHNIKLNKTKKGATFKTYIKMLKETKYF